MLENNYAQLKDNLIAVIAENNISNFDEPAVDKLIDYITHFKKDNIIYPRMIKQHFAIDIQTVYLLLIIFTSYNILKIVNELYCKKCNKFQSTKPVSNASLFNKDDLVCEYCDSDLDVETDVLVVFQRC